MATAPFNISETVPGDSDQVSQFPGGERTFRDIVESWLLTEHDTYGHHKIPVLTTSGRDAISTWSVGSEVYNSTTATLQILSATGVWSPAAPAATTEFTSGTALIFSQGAAPTGWTQDTTVNDRVLRVISTTGAGTGGSWTISGVTVDAHTLTLAETPSHTHAWADPTGYADISEGTGPTDHADCWKGNPAGGIGVHSANTSSKGGDGSHTHGVTSDGNWRPSYLNVIRCTKN